MLLLFNSGSGSTTTINTPGTPPSFPQQNVCSLSRSSLRSLSPRESSRSRKCTPDASPGTRPAIGSEMVHAGLTDERGSRVAQGGRQGECQPGPFSTRPATRSEIICCPTPTPSLTTPSVKTTFKVEQLCAALLVLSYQTNSCTCGMPQDALRIPQPMHEDRRSTRH